ncbi:hypothetical protein HMPREF3038_01564 [Akkermansia sp. KLE1797]|nr:hypothetical protein HMPREF3038_01564 [Akkermansia sp. KLE1797]KZA05537.1 hypothetical protein HMPREF1326_00712 [Akkermansia sp. KLE1605]
MAAKPQSQSRKKSSKSSMMNVGNGFLIYKAAIIFLGTYLLD